MIRRRQLAGPVSPRKPGHRTSGARSAGPFALALALSFAFAADDASAAAVRSSATALSALAVFAALLFIREWPVALTGSIWAAGTLFAAALWLWRARLRPEWFSSGSGTRNRATRNRPLVPTGAFNGSGAVPANDAEPDSVLTAARHCFVSLQGAWDAGDIEGMRRHTTSEMLDELVQELPMRGAGPNRTDVVTLDAALLGLEEFGSRYIASVQFSGMIRESTEQGAAPFKEVWMLTCPKDELPAWRLARHQALL